MRYTKEDAGEKRKKRKRTRERKQDIVSICIVFEEGASVDDRYL